MNLKEQFKMERNALKNGKRPYETAAFIIFAVMLFQQMAYWWFNLFKFIQNGWMSTNLPSTPTFVIRIIAIDNTKWLYVILGVLGLMLWYAIIFVLVFDYCNRKGYAKWVWTSLILFGPATILFVPTYLIYAIYVFRPYIFRFIRRGVDEYKMFAGDYQFDEEKEETVQKTE
ncbi:MAG: hypothetical protein UMR38_04150 [Candidatus Izemoplasma sp.]|nr:hypothetical protein [Candidatus Izemoplasma sp.]